MQGRWPRKSKRWQFCAVAQYGDDNVRAVRYYMSRKCRRIVSPQGRQAVPRGGQDLSRWVVVVGGPDAATGSPGIGLASASQSPSNSCRLSWRWGKCVRALIRRWRHDTAVWQTHSNNRPHAVQLAGWLNYSSRSLSRSVLITYTHSEQHGERWYKNQL